MLKIDRASNHVRHATPAGLRLALGVFAVAVAASVLAFPDVWRSMVSKWYESETFAHGFLIAPISAWMIWQRRGALAGAQLAPAPLGFVALAAAGLGWMLGELAGVNAVRQLAVVAMIPAIAWALFGWALVRRLLFPLAFLLFMVPLGEFLLPVMMQHTADATVLALRASGIPVYREGLNFQIPSGSWSVVEACSGLRYLIASAVLGTVFAYLHYTSLARRAAFVAAAILVPVLANWIRAYLIVMIGHLSSMQLATGVDHLVYGWLFFGLVMGLLFWLGMRWREPPPQYAALPEAPGAPEPAGRGAAPAQAGAPARATTPGAWRRGLVALAGIGLVLGAVRAAPAALLDVTPRADFAQALRARLPALRTDAAPLVQPQFSGERARVAGTLDGQPRVDAFVAYYARQEDGHELVSSDNRLVLLDDPVWRIARSDLRDTSDTRVVETELYAGARRLLVWQWYAIGGRSVADDYRAKLLTALAALTGRGDHSAVAILSTPADDGAAAARDRLAARAGALRQALAELTASGGR